jgi:tetratricopeptide (TPR) repeat protein
MDEDTGEDALPVEGADAPPPVFPHHVGEGSLAEALMDWLAFPAGREQRRFLAAHPELLQPRCLALLDEWIRAEARQEEAQRLREARSLLQDVLERGGTAETVCEAYVNAYGGFMLDLPAWLEEVEGRLSALRRLGQPHQTAPARVELLRGALDRASGESAMPPELLGALQYELALAWQEQPPTDLSQAYETVIALCESALRGLSRDRYPRQHAYILNALGWTYARRVAGERRDNLERAISCHRQALQVFSLQALPQAYARTQTLLGQVYWQRVEGGRRDNVEQALACCREALRVYTTEAFPHDYARTLHTLGAIYAQRIEGELRENLEQAIACCRESLRVRTLAGSPIEYAHTQNNLGINYWRRVAGGRRENLEQAIACFREALRVYTAEAFTYDYARAQNNLGAAYMARIAGRRRDNLAQAIACYREALRVWTLQDFPSQYAKLQNNLGEAYLHSLEGERSDHLERAIACFSEALHVTSRESFPQDVAMMQQNLGDAYRQRIAGERQENLRSALACYDEALQFYTLEAFPSEHRQVQLLRAEVCALLADWAAAYEAYAAANGAEELLAALGAGAEGRAAVLQEGRDAATRAGFALVRLGKVAEAAVTMERGRARGLAEALELHAADPARITDAGRRSRYTLARQAFIASQAALHAPLPADLDEDARRRLGLARTAAYREAKAAFDRVVLDIREARDPDDFLQASLDATTLCEAAARCGPAHALVYLAATPWGGMALAVLAGRQQGYDVPRFAALDLPDLTGALVDSLIETRLHEDSEYPTGGFDCAQRGNALDLLQHWPGATLSEQAMSLHTACVAAARVGSLDAAAQEVCSHAELEQLVARPLASLDEEERGLLAGTLNHLVLHLELERSLSALSDAALIPLVGWLRAEGAGSLTLIPCGLLAAFPLLAGRLPDGNTVSESLPASVAPSARALLQAGQSGKERLGIYALGNPYPTLQSLRWGEAEALTMATLGKRLGRPAASRVQWEATREWLLEALRGGFVVDASCHGRFEVRDFLRSRLLLANEEALTLADLLSDQADLRGLRLLILSACQTALLDLQGARDEVHSLAAGVLQAGARAVLAVLWAVDDKATYLLVVRFAQEWLPRADWEPPAHALARAQRWLRSMTNRDLREWEATLLASPLQSESLTNPVGQQEESLFQEDVSTVEAGEPVAVCVRGVRFDALHAQELVQKKAGELESEARPYAAPYYWAGFQLTGW